jgi:hypothetical protein
MALYKRLFFHFSNIYSESKNRKFVFTKNYSDICKQWLGGLAVLKYKSKIEREQLGPHFEALIKSEIIKKPLIEKNAKGDDFNIIFKPGKAFFEDYRSFYGCYPQMSIPFQQISDHRSFEQPMTLVSYFYQNLLKTDQIEDEILDQSEVDLASKFLSEHSFNDVKSWIDYAIEQAQKTNFQMKKFGGIKNYKTEFFARKEMLKKQKSKLENQAIENAQQQREYEYNCFVKEQRYKFEQACSTDPQKKAWLEAKQAVFLEEAKKQADKISVAKLKARLSLNALIDQEAKVPSFEEWLSLRS